MNDIEVKFNPRDMSEDHFDRLVYLRIFEGCNLHCDHCFIPNNPKRMSDDMLLSVPDLIRRVSPEDARILIQWHGGEPTALGRKHLEHAINLINKNRGDLTYTHGIQTNLLNYTSDWAELYHEHFGSSVGVSWDYKIRKIRSNGSNDEYEKTFWKNVKQLQDDGLEPYFVVTGTKPFFEHFKDPFKMFEFFESKGIYRLHIERLTEVGNARDNWNSIGLSNLEYSSYMSRIYKAYKLHSKNNLMRDSIRISPFDGLDESVDRLLAGTAGGYGCLSGACDSKYHTIDANGYKAGCTALTSEYDNKRVSGDVQVIRFMDMATEREVRQLTCDGCEFKPICSSGCLATNKFDFSNECSGAKKLFSAIKKIKIAN